MDVCITLKAIILLNLIFFSWTSSLLIKHLVHKNVTSTCGRMISNHEYKKLLACSTKCSELTTCKALLYSKHTSMAERCILILKDNNDKIQLSQWIEYKYYNVIDASQKSCTVPGSSPIKPEKWTSDCPKIYQSFDAMPGISSHGPVQSVASVKGGNAYAFTNAPTNQGYLNLGMYPQSNFCFPSPELCREGFSIAFWLRMEGPNGAYQGFITSMPHEGPGFTLCLTDQSQLIFFIRRDSDTKRDKIFISESSFLLEHNFNTWIHYVFTYKFNQMINVSRLAGYLNGKPRPDSEKFTDSWYVSNNDDYDGRLHIGHYYVNDDTHYSGNMQFDELIIFEQELPCDDVFRLYEAYP